MAGSLDDSLVENFEILDDLCEKKIEENENKVKALIHDINEERCKIEGILRKNQVKLEKEAKKTGEEIITEIKSIKNECDVIRNQLEQTSDERELFKLKEKLKKNIEKVEGINYQLKFDMADCECPNKNEVIFEDNENRRSNKRRRMSEESGDNYIKESKISIVCIFNYLLIYFESESKFLF